MQRFVVTLGVCGIVALTAIAGLSVPSFPRSARPASAPSVTLTPASSIYLSTVFGPPPAPTPTDIPGLPAITNGDFELGENGDWTLYTPGVITNASGQIAHSGQWLAHFGGEGFSIDQLVHPVNLPTGIPLYLRYYRVIEGYPSPHSDGFFVRVSGDLVDIVSLDPTTDTQGQWKQVVIDLNAYAGQSVLLQFQVSTDEGGSQQCVRG